MNQCANRRLSLEHQFAEHLEEQRVRSNLQSYRYREQIFQRKLDRLKRNIERIDLHPPENENEESLTEDRLLMSNCLPRIQNHYRLMNFSAETEQRLLNSNSMRPKSAKENPSESLSNSNRKKSSSGERRSSFSRSMQNEAEEKNPFRSYIDQQLYDERRRQRDQNQRKSFLLKDFDELKHRIDDPHSTFSVLAALSRALLFLESESE